MAALLLLALLLASCLPTTGPEIPEVSRRQQKLFKASFAEVWAALHAAVEETHLRVTEDDEREGKVGLFVRKTARARPDELVRELQTIAELDKARRMGLSNLSEYMIDYTLGVRRLGDHQTGLDVETRIHAVDRSQVILIAPGIAHVVPRNFPVPSRGILERELVERIASRLLLSEEMLYSLGVLGRD